MYCNKCRKKVMDGVFCEFCGTNLEENMKLQKSVVKFVTGLVILSVGIFSFGIAFFTMLSDLTFENYLLKGYDYIGPLTTHEIVMVVFTFVGFWLIYIGVIMVSSNKSEAACVKSSYKTIAHIAYAVAVVLFVCAFIAAIPHFQKGGYLGVSLSDSFGGYLVLGEFFRS